MNYSFSSYLCAHAPEKLDSKIQYYFDMQVTFDFFKFSTAFIVHIMQLQLNILR